MKCVRCNTEKEPDAFYATHQGGFLFHTNSRFNRQFGVSNFHLVSH